MTASSPSAARDLSEAGAAVVRPLTISDAEAAAKIIRTAFAAQSRATAPPSSALLETSESVAAKIADGGGFSVRSNGRLVAVALWQEVGEALVVARVSVLPEARGGSVSRHLIVACEAEARSRGLSSVRLRVRLALPENERLFQRMGFRRLLVEAHPGFDQPTVAVLEKRLS